MHWQDTLYLEMLIFFHIALFYEEPSVVTTSTNNPVLYRRLTHPMIRWCNTVAGAHLLLKKHANDWTQEPLNGLNIITTRA